ncbi:heterogeneous nuclear ribonucleoprotein l2 [Anaeramoeba flamelloides]|uniref:Heterogeneous nuclear ribonucleoprotein l2 n=1 Tax=Anaeramoeba flamelloides TaxID=1746091 RepID=A0AAV7Y952_9EUKA|nr:heterogeneous nuclear ribonucleoprotein l2 [Anaeramoeba flamelloides]
MDQSNSPNKEEKSNPFTKKEVFQTDQTHQKILLNNSLSSNIINVNKETSNSSLVVDPQFCSLPSASIPSLSTEERNNVFNHHKEKLSISLATPNTFPSLSGSTHPKTLPTLNSLLSDTSSKATKSETIPPNASKVVNISNLPIWLNEQRLIQLITKFGEIEKINVFDQKSQALVEMKTLESAIQIVQHHKKKPKILFGNKILFKFSKSQNITKNNQQLNQNIITSKVMILKINDLIKQPTLESIRSSISQYYEPEEILILFNQKNQLQALIQFSNLEQAQKVAEKLHLSHGFGYTCRIKIKTCCLQDLHFITSLSSSDNYFSRKRKNIEPNLGLNINSNLKEQNIENNFEQKLKKKKHLVKKKEKQNYNDFGKKSSSGINLEKGRELKRVSDIEKINKTLNPKNENKNENENENNYIKNEGGKHNEKEKEIEIEAEIQRGGYKEEEEEEEEEKLKVKKRERKSNTMILEKQSFNPKEFTRKLSEHDQKINRLQTELEKIKGALSLVKQSIHPKSSEKKSTINSGIDNKNQLQDYNSKNKNRNQKKKSHNQNQKQNRVRSPYKNHEDENNSKYDKYDKYDNYDKYDKYDKDKTSNILFVSNISENLSYCQLLFRLFSCYGRVEKIKILFNRRDAALIQMSSKAYSQIAKINLENEIIFGKKIKIIYSRIDELDLKTKHKKHYSNSETDLQLDMDFRKSRLHRFPYYFGDYKKQILPPSPVLFIANIPEYFTDEYYKEKVKFTETNLVSFIKRYGDMRNYKAFSKNKRKMALVEMMNKEIAINTLILLHNYTIGDRNLSISFSDKKFVFPHSNDND